MALNYNPSPDAYMRSLQCLPLESLFILSVEPSFCNYFSFFVFVLCLFLCTQVSDLFPVSKQSHSRRWFGVILCWVCSKYSISCAPNSYSSIYLFLAGCQFHWKLEPWLILCLSQPFMVVSKRVQLHDQNSKYLFSGQNFFAHVLWLPPISSSLLQYLIRTKID